MNRAVKAAYYAVGSPLMRANALIYRVLRAPRSGPLKVHLGPGQSHYIDDWINVDANMFTASCDLWADLRHRMPFRTASVDAFYSHHMIEHLPDLDRHLRDVFRCLKPGGVYRVAGPNGDSAITKFVENDLQWFGDFPDKRASIGGRFENFIFCRREHLTILTRSFLEELMTAVGFERLKVCRPAAETNYPRLFQECLAQEHESDPVIPHTLVVEGVKPEAQTASAAQR
jgi:SAM-dependent methyltransferase